MSAQQRIRRQLVSQTFAEGGSDTFDLPRNYDLESLMIRMTGNVNVGTTFAGGVRAESPAQILKRVEVIAEGRTTLDQLSGPSAMYSMYMREGNPLTNYGRVTPAAAVAVQPFAFNVLLDRAMFDGPRPKDTNFRTTQLGLFQLKLTYGVSADLYQAGAGAGTLTAPVVALDIDELIEYPNAQKQVSVPAYVMKRSQIDLLVGASNNNIQQRMPTGNLLRSVLMMARTNGEPSNALLNNFILQRGVDTRYNRSAAALKIENAGQLGYTPPTGLYLADLAKTGGRFAKITDCWNLAGSAEVYAVFDITVVATTIMTMTVTELIPRQ